LAHNPAKQSPFPEVEMSTATSKEIVREGVQRVWNGDLGLIADDYVDHNMAPWLPPGREGLAALYQATLVAFPDFNVTLEQLIADGDLVAVRITNRGTNTGSFVGNPPTGKHATWTTIAIFRVADGMIVERWGVIDLFSLLGQLGLQPPG
jgi:predicted ester cyclase